MLSKKKPQDKVDPEYLVGLDTASAQPAPAGVKPFIKKHWKPIIAVVCAAAVAAAVLVPKNSAKPLGYENTPHNGVYLTYAYAPALFSDKQGSDLFKGIG